MLSSGVAKQHEVTITFTYGVLQAFLLSVMLHSSEIFLSTQNTPPRRRFFHDWNYILIPIMSREISWYLEFIPEIAVNLLSKGSRHLFILCCYLQLYSITFHAHSPCTLACSSTVVITKPWTSVLRRCHMSAACFTYDLDLSSGHDPLGIQLRARRITLLSTNDQVCLFDNLKRKRSQWKEAKKKEYSR